MPRPFLPVAFAAFSRDIFAIAYSPSTMGSPKSFVLSHDGRLAQPWGRVDMKRDIYALLPDPAREAGAGFVALSNEGDIYEVGAEGAPVTTLPDAGLTGRGGTFRLANAGDTVLVLGRGNQVWARDEAGAWQELAPDITPPEGYGPPTWTDALGLADGTLLLAGNAKAPDKVSLLIGAPKPPALGRPPTPEETAAYLAEHRAYVEAREAERATHFPMETLGFIARRTEQGWDLAETVQKGAIYGLAQAPDGAIWAVGDAGQILRSDDGARSFKAVTEARDIRYAGIAPTHDGMIVLQGRALSRVDAEGRMHPLPIPTTPQTQGKWLAPVDYAALPEGVFFLDANHGLLFRDASDWQRIDIPAALTGPAKAAKAWVAG